MNFLIYFFDLFLNLSKAAKRVDKLDHDFIRTIKELETLQKINSDYIVKYLGFDQDTQYLYVIMKLYEVKSTNLVKKYISDCFI